jgi:ribosomal protein S18 acetylase RimI-like enzyme
MHLDLALRHMMKSQGSIQSEKFFRLITGEKHPLGNLAILREFGDASVIEEAVAPLMNVSNPVSVVFMADVNDAITGHMTAKGFSKAEPIPAMAIDIASLTPTKPPEGYDLVKVLSPEVGTAWANALSAGYDLPRGLARLFSPELHGASAAPDAALQFFGIQREGKMVATSMLYLANGIAGIYCVATLPEERGRGLGAHVTAEALRAANRIGYEVGVLQSSASGHSVYLALGFRNYASIPMFVRMPN